MAEGDGGGALQRANAVTHLPGASTAMRVLGSGSATYFEFSADRWVSFD